MISESDLPLGIAYSNAEARESFAKIRRFLRGGGFIPGHEPTVFSDPANRGFELLSDSITTIVD